MHEQALTEMRIQSPLVHCITNYVAMNFAANTCLAAGASPAMVHAEQEVRGFAEVAAALTINIGTLSTPWAESMILAAKAASNSGTPWVLDPVAHFISPFRTEATQKLVDEKPTIIRGNASEILALAGAQSTGKGVDSGDSVADAQEAATQLARKIGSIVAVTGEKDLVTDGETVVRLSGGSALMPKVTAMGCSLTALMGGYAAVSSPFIAAQSALAHFKAAGSLAQTKADGPGSFQVHFLDGLSAVQPADLKAYIDA